MNAADRDAVNRVVEAAKEWEHLHALRDRKHFDAAVYFQAIDALVAAVRALPEDEP